ncbi:MAG TPA: ribosome small subunit-dependent GTPase A [Thermomicrobiales bacterium]|nr:ribosome small subunit-dependent GTPase A [Thermomicrobiales bacterium]
MPRRSSQRSFRQRPPLQDVNVADLPVPDNAIPGLVVRAHGLWYEVSLQAGPRASETVIATMRGVLKKNRRRTDIVAVGDRVQVVELPDDEAAIVAIEPRTRALVRTARNTRDTEQVIVANPDQVMFVFAIADPEPHVRMLDRFLILAEMQGLPARIVVNKADLDDTGIAERIFGIYRDLYPVHLVSAATGHGIDSLREILRGKMTVVAGPSGVGKSSLLNAIDPENLRETSAISEATGKGRHTTVGSRLYRIGEETYLADTPGIRSIAMHAIPPEDIDRYFIELQPFLGQCFYQDCTHVHEPDCAVKDAVVRGEIGEERYESYVALRTGGEGSA